MQLPLTPVRFLVRALDLFGSSLGVVSGDRQFTYAEFGARCQRLASALKQYGIAPGDRVAFLSFNNHQLLEAYYGVPMARAAVMPLNVRLSQPELTNILNHSGARLLFYETDFAPLVESFRQDCQGIERFVALNGDYEEFLSTGREEGIGYTDIDDSATAELFYTSGSTGTPKGVMLSHRALYQHAMSVATCYPEPESMVDLHTIPLFHANGWGHAHVDVMFGVPQIMVRRFDPVGVLELIEKHRATDMSLVPTMANALLQVPNLGGRDVSSLRDIQMGGAASSPELIERMEKAFGCRVWAGYGLTETAPVLCVARSEARMKFASDEERWFSQSMAGRPIAGVELRVVDEAGKDVPSDGQAIGEIVVRCDFLMTGYYRDEQATAAVMRDGWFHTGDMAVRDSRGFVRIVDRKKEIIVSGGENISSIEIERAIAAHPAVLECAVMPAPDPKWGEVPAAIVVKKPEAELDEVSLIAFLEGRLGRFKLPRIIEFDEGPLPKTGTGKIRKLQLRERFWAGRERRIGE